ncbi:hypothetical protein [Streptomyces sp. Da 82-17]|uniref:hypothetical protein n=1 Tax=Streptomyces sp. Da 82-17 TaxID=3377116 RepID=UPI0038D35BE3
MAQLYAVEIEPEVRAWLEALPAKHFLKIDEYVGLLAEHAATLGEPFARHLGDGVREHKRLARPNTALLMTSSCE